MSEEKDVSTMMDSSALEGDADNISVSHGVKEGEDWYLTQVYKLLESNRLDEIDEMLDEACPSQLDRTLEMFGQKSDKLENRNLAFIDKLLAEETESESIHSQVYTWRRGDLLTHNTHRALGQTIVHLSIVVCLCTIFALDTSGHFREIFAVLLPFGLGDSPRLIQWIGSGAASLIGAAVMFVILGLERREMDGFRKAVKKLRSDSSPWSVAEDMYLLSKCVSGSKRLKSYSIVIAGILLTHVFVTISVSMSEDQGFSNLALLAIFFELVVGLGALSSSLLIGYLAMKSQMSVVGAVHAMRLDESGHKKEQLLDQFMEDQAEDRIYLFTSWLTHAVPFVGRWVRRA